MKVGFVGLGIMGKPMAMNLLKAGYELTVFDFNQTAVAEVVAAGAKEAASGQKVAEQTDVVITMLPNSPNVSSALFAGNGIAAGLTAGQTVIDMSSISPVASKQFAQRLQDDYQVDFLDAPVSGGEPGAIDGSIAIMVGGQQQVFDKFKELFDVLGGSATLVGGVGAGNITKLANQMIVAINIAAVSEAYSLAKKAAVDPECVYHAIRGGLAGSAVMEQKSAKILAGDFEPGFRVELHIKDLQNALDTGHEITVSTPFTALAMEVMQSLKAHGLEKKDHSAIANYYELINGLKLQD